MTDIANLTLAINVLLSQMDEHFAKAQSAMGVKPDLNVAVQQAQATHSSIADLAILIMQAENTHGIKQPPDVIQRINDCHSKLTDISYEIAMCNSVILGGNKRGKVAHAAN